jgi:hypothetical protein
MRLAGEVLELFFGFIFRGHVKTKYVSLDQEFGKNVKTLKPINITQKTAKA